VLIQSDAYAGGCSNDHSFACFPRAHQRQTGNHVPAAASVSATGKHSAVMVFVDQTTTIGNDAPTQSTSSVRVSLDKVDGRWLISQFDPV
jgi:hypothetical protein